MQEEHHQANKTTTENMEATRAKKEARLVGMPMKYRGRAPLWTISSRAMRNTLHVTYA